MSNQRSKVYLEGHHVLAPHLAEYANQLAASDFDVTSEWHDGPKLSMISELIMILGRCDLLIVFMAGASADSWLKVGWAMASGLRCVFVGAVIPPEFDTIVNFKFDTWEDLAEGGFARLGSTRFKKVRRS